MLCSDYVCLTFFNFFLLFVFVFVCLKEKEKNDEDDSSRVVVGIPLSL